MQENLLEHLNDEQLEAATHISGPLMIVAGAGTGKTTVITHRVGWLIEQGHAKPDEILALTFTEKAANEMEERVDQLLPIGYVEMWISTFHAFCERILRQHGIDIGLPHEFKLVDDVGALLLIRKNFNRFDLNYYKPKGNPTRFIKALLKHFSRLKDEMITPKQYFKYVENLQMDEDTAEGVANEDAGEDLAEIARLKELAHAYHVYQQLLLENNSIDLSDLVTYTIELFKERPNILNKFRNQFKFVLVDEFQDTNRAQYELVKLIVPKTGNITVVGDDDQSIYKFRGASLSNILKFKEDFPQAKHVVLTKNYRSAECILEQAYNVIQKNNPDRLEVKEGVNKKLKSKVKIIGSVEHIHCSTVDDEVVETVNKIITLKQNKKCSWSDFAILIRANSHAEPFIMALDRAGVPYRFLAMSGLYAKPIILDMLAWMRVLHQPHDSPSMYRILSHPQIGVSEPAVAELTLYCRRKSASLFEAMKSAPGITKLDPDSASRIHDLLSSMSTLQTKANRMPVNELFLEIAKESGLLAGVREQREVEQQEQYSLLNQFHKRLKSFEELNDDKTLYHFLDEFEHERDAGEVGGLDADIEEGPDVVNIMTVHASKGLEFRYVFIVNLIEQRFPSQRKNDPVPLPPDLVEQTGKSDRDLHIQEERRLFYVALTRAKESVFLLSAEHYGGTRKRKPSRFIEELDIEPTMGAASTFEAGKKIKKEQTADNKPPEKISFTQIAAFSTCPLQYKFAHILKVPVFGRHSLSFGKSVHNTLHRFMTEYARRQGGPQGSLFDREPPSAQEALPKKKDLMRMYEDCWIDEWYPSKSLKEKYWKEGKKSLTDYYNQIKRNPPDIHSLEKGFTLKIGGVAVRGRIDRIDHLDDGVEIIDYKTGAPKEKLDWKRRRQLVLYKMAAESCFDPPLKVKKLTYHYVEDNSTVSFEAKEKDVEKLKNEILGTVDLIKESNFSPTPGFHCKWCDFKDICEFSRA